ncbi:methionine--tRNA ligase [Pseudothermotoga lettingae]|uniref:methionine--tRNA ligase n=2 Tax=Pseudothermotoga TaxID=1643951 RepID=UPI00074AADC1|nr:methionine--tRNA ligase [Pseudothermotoga lettingae]KUK21795.1 MAG: Methionine--tRNA ligase [Pseudothermotoga lettingae]
MKFYITTPIYYVNSDPHVGSAYTTIIADIIARYKRMMGYDVFFLTGTDEHGQKILQASSSLGKDPQSFCDELADRFKQLWKKLNITNDGFIRTTDPNHMKVVQYFVKKMVENNDIYKGEYRGWYCVPCETYWNEDEISSDKLCPSCGRELKYVSEKNYFFRLSRYQDKLLRYYEEHPEFVQPDFRRNEMMRILEGGLKDLSITRTTFKWGVPMPDDPEHVIYVWVDALINYISAIGYPEDLKTFEKYWPADLHLIGKEINRFHSIIWPAMLMSAGLELPRTVFAHGWLTVDGQKISKSLGNAIDPKYFVEEYGNDVLRFYLVRDINFGKDGDFSEKNLVNRLNSDLANDYGNLLHRTLAMIKKYYSSTMPRPGAHEQIDEKFKHDILQCCKEYQQFMDQYSLTQAVEKVMEALAISNKYFDERKPWVLAKQKDFDKLSTVLFNVCESLLKVATMFSPIMPDSSEEVFSRLGFDQKASKYMLETWNILKPGKKIVHAEPLFAKRDQKEIKRSEVLMTDTIDFDQFKKVNLRVGKVISAERVPKSEKLLKLLVDLGELGSRQIVAGIAKYYKPEDLIGKNIVVVSNLKPVKLMGIESEGMLLAAKDDTDLKILTIDGEISPGAQIS